MVEALPRWAERWLMQVAHGSCRLLMAHAAGSDEPGCRTPAAPVPLAATDAGCGGDGNACREGSVGGAYAYAVDQTSVGGCWVAVLRRLGLRLSGVGAPTWL